MHVTLYSYIFNINTQGKNTEIIHPIDLVILKPLLCSKLYSGIEYTDTVLLFVFIP